MIKRSLLLVAFCLAALLPAQAQVVIKERVMVSEEDSLAHHDPLQMAHIENPNNTSYTVIMPYDGTLRLRYYGIGIRTNYFVTEYHDIRYPEPPTTKPVSFGGHFLKIEHRGNGVSRTIFEEIEPDSIVAKAKTSTHVTIPRFDRSVLCKECEFYPYYRLECSWLNFRVFVDPIRPHSECEGQIIHSEDRENANPLSLLGYVKKGDQISISYMQPPGRIDPIPLYRALGNEWSVLVRYENDSYPFTYYRWRPAQGFAAYLEIVAPKIDFLIQTDDVHWEEGTLVVSGFNPNNYLKESTPFVSEYKDESCAFDEFKQIDFGSDCDVFRFQASDVPAGLDIKFLMEVSRGGKRVNTQTYDAIEGVIEGKPVYRSNKHIRLVSNGRPEVGAHSAATYDDEVFNKSPDQTIRVELEDSVHVTLLINGQKTSAKVGRMVGLPASDDHRYDAVRRVEINWQWLESLSKEDIDPVLTTARMSEDWAQANIYFKVKELADGSLSNKPFRKDAVGNVLLVELEKSKNGKTRRPGSVSIVLEGQATPISLTYGADKTLKEVAEAFKASLAQRLGTEVRIYAAETRDEKQGLLINLDEAEKMHIIVGKAKDFRFAKATGDNSVNIGIKEFNLDYLQLHDLVPLARSLQDDDPLTVDAFILPDNSMLPKRPFKSMIGVHGKGFNDKPYHAIPHTLFLYPYAADISDDWPLVAGHEMGHVLYPHGHVDDDPAIYWVKDKKGQHLMYSKADRYETSSSGKRFDRYSRLLVRESPLMQKKSRYEK